MAGLGVNVHGSKKVVGTANYFREKYGKLEKIVCDVDQGQELSDLADQVCGSLHIGCELERLLNMYEALLLIEE